MDVQKLIGEVARKHQVLLSPNDPIFMAVTLYEALLADHLAQVKAALDQAQQASGVAVVQQVERARLVTAQAVADGARVMGDQVRQAGGKLKYQLEPLVEEAVAAAAAASDARRAAQRSASAALVAACALAAVLAALWLRFRP